MMRPQQPDGRKNGGRGKGSYLQVPYFEGHNESHIRMEAMHGWPPCREGYGYVCLWFRELLYKLHTCVGRGRQVSRVRGVFRLGIVRAE